MKLTNTLKLYYNSKNFIPLLCGCVSNGYTRSKTYPSLPKWYRGFFIYSIFVSNIHTNSFIYKLNLINLLISPFKQSCTVKSNISGGGIHDGALDSNPSSAKIMGDIF